MNRTRIWTFLSLLLSAGFLLVSCREVSPPKTYGATPSPELIAWQQLEYYMFIHFGPNTFTDVEWGNGKEDPGIFNPSDLDCRQWAETAKNAGMKGIILTAKHHDGFCLWPSAYSKHTVRESPWKNGQGDILQELSEACREFGLKFGVYISPWDQNHPSYGTDVYNDIFLKTIEEVLSAYGPVFEIWFDGANGEGKNGKKQIYDWEAFHKAVCRLQPKTIHAIEVNGIGPSCRWMGNEKGIAGTTNWSTLNNPVGLAVDILERGEQGGKLWVPAETDVSIRPGWFYSPSTDDKVKSVEKLMDIYYTSVGRNSNLLLNVPPDKRGRIHPNDSIRLMQFREAREAAFADNLARGAKISAGNTRGKSSRYSPKNLLEDNYDSYWATDDSVTATFIEVDMNKTQSINRLVLQEYIPLGQRVARFSVYYDAEGQWIKLLSATTIGYKRILRFPLTKTSKIKIEIEESLASPVLNKLEIYRSPELLAEPVFSRDKKGMLSMSCPTGDPVIRYTLDGSEPGPDSEIYTQPLPFSEGGSVKAFASIENGSKKSNVVTANFSLAPAKFQVISPQSEDAARIVDGLETEPAQLPSKEPLVIDLGEKLKLKGFFYLPLNRWGASNIFKYRLSGSPDGKIWTQILSNATFNNIGNNPIKQEVVFDKQQEVRFLKMEVLESTGEAASYTAVEIGALL